MTNEMNGPVNGTIAALLAGVLMLMGCGPGGDIAGKGDAPDPLEARARITAMEDSLFNSSGFDARSAQALLDVYKRYALTFQRDTLVPEYLFRAASVCRTMGDPEQSIVLYDRIMVDYSGWDKLPDVLYLKAFVMDTDLGRKGEAKRAYQKVINVFPEHPFAHDARMMIQNLDLTDEELVRRFQEQEQAAATP
jgi:tetratricopeptide (TPR) repeat protein